MCDSCKFSFCQESFLIYSQKLSSHLGHRLDQIPKIVNDQVKVVKQTDIGFNERLNCQNSDLGRGTQE